MVTMRYKFVIEFMNVNSISSRKRKRIVGFLANIFSKQDIFRS